MAEFKTLNDPSNVEERWAGVVRVCVESTREHGAVDMELVAIMDGFVAAGVSPN